MEDCVDLCNKYSINNISSTFHGEFEFYEYFIDKFNKFKIDITKMLKSGKNKEKINEIESSNLSDLTSKNKIE